MWSLLIVSEEEEESEDKGGDADVLDSNSVEEESNDEIICEICKRGDDAPKLLMCDKVSSNDVQFVCVYFTLIYIILFLCFCFVFPVPSWNSYILFRT
mgnify:CR=1 FL=1